jgi:hypothetical protein
MRCIFTFLSWFVACGYELFEVEVGSRKLKSEVRSPKEGKRSEVKGKSALEDRSRKTEVADHEVVIR